MARYLMFQSAPAISGGRSRCGAKGGGVMRSFNPRPPSLAGDPRCGAKGGGVMRSFNPRPPSLAGDPVYLVGSSSLYSVSIRARHLWRAIPWWASRSTLAKPFQSAPAISGGRSHQRRNLLRLVFCFNPRPPSLAGDPVINCYTKQAYAVSIRARHLWRAIQPVNGVLHHQVTFQSAPAISGGRSGIFSGSSGR